MLIKCPECELPVSDKALACPHCGRQLKRDLKQQIRTPKRMRLPNGFGQISEIKNAHLRKRFRAMVSVGKKENGRPIVKPLKPESYFTTYNEAYAALVEYHKNPFDLSPGITLKELYEKWLPEYEKNVTFNTYRNAKTTWTHIAPLYDREVKQLKVSDIKNLIERPEMPLQTRKRIKSLLIQVLNFGADRDLIDRNVAAEYQLPRGTSKQIERAKKHHLDYTDDEMAMFWRNKDNFTIGIILIQCYSGWRPQELGLIRLEDVNITEWTFKGGMKTDAGRERIVPIHSAIRDLVLWHYNRSKEAGHEYLFMNEAKRKTSRRFSYEDFRHGYDRIAAQLKLAKGHAPHDGRVQFVTMCKKVNVDDYAIKYMVGHEISDITERVYTRRDVSWLSKEIEKIKVPENYVGTNL